MGLNPNHDRLNSLPNKVGQHIETTETEGRSKWDVDW